MNDEQLHRRSVLISNNQNIQIFLTYLNIVIVWNSLGLILLLALTSPCEILIPHYSHHIYKVKLLFHILRQLRNIVKKKKGESEID